MFILMIVVVIAIIISVNISITQRESQELTTAKLMDMPF